MIMTYCIYNQYKITRKKDSNCWLCGNIFYDIKCNEYETIFGNYINLHNHCFAVAILLLVCTCLWRLMYCQYHRANSDLFFA